MVAVAEQEMLANDCMQGSRKVVEDQLHHTQKYTVEDALFQLLALAFAVLIPLVGVAVCLLPLPFANDWKHQMCWNGILVLGLGAK